MQLARSKNRDVLAVVFLVAWPFFYFWPVPLAREVLFTTDIIRLFYPFSVELARALNESRLPLWTPGILAGFPLLAEGQVGALYPVNLILYKLLPTHLALSFGTLLHLSWAGCGMYILVRSVNFRAASALLAGFVFSFNGFVFGHLSHLSVIATLAWLPWLIFFQSRFQRARKQDQSRVGVWFFLTCFSFGIQFLPGAVQIAFLNTLVFVLIGIVSGFWENEQERVGQRPLSFAQSLKPAALAAIVPLILGVGIAAIQLLPTMELVGYSVRSGASESFFTSYSLPPDFLLQFLSPYFQGEPAEATGEYWSYFGFAPLVLAICAPFLRRDRRTIFYCALALGALSLALGGLNPVYALLYRLPVLNLFRVPARYLLLFVFAVALLSATAFEELSNRLDRISKVMWWGAGFALLTLFSVWLAYSQPLEFWLNAWQVLPWLLAPAAIFALWLAMTHRMARETFVAAMVGLTIFDLASFAPPFLATIDALTPIAIVETVPRSLPALETGNVPARVFTDLSVFPSVPALRGSLFPNTALIYGKESTQSYTSLAFARQEAYLFSISPAMLNLLNVRFFLVPLEPRPQIKPTTPPDSLGLDVVNNEAIIPPQTVAAIEIASLTEQAGDLADGTVVGQVEVRLGDGTIETFPLRLGIETADWDYERKSTLGAMKHSRAQVAHSFAAFWRSFGRTFQGHNYLARFDVAPSGQTRHIIGVNVRVRLPEARLTVERVTLYDEKNRAVSLATLTGKNNFSLAYLSDTVAAWENGDAMPRAFVVHAAEIANDDAAFARLHENGFRADRLVLLSDGSAMQAPDDSDSGADRVVITNFKPEQVSLSVNTQRPGYLVLSDSWYPGWNALVDGRSVPIYRADVIFRAVPIEPGQHTVVFEYRPMAVVWGAMISVASLLVTLGIATVGQCQLFWRPTQ